MSQYLQLSLVRGLVLALVQTYSERSYCCLRPYTLHMLDRNKRGNLRPGRCRFGLPGAWSIPTYDHVAIVQANLLHCLPLQKAVWTDISVVKSWLALTRTPPDHLALFFHHGGIVMGPPQSLCCIYRRVMRLLDTFDIHRTSG